DGLGRRPINRKYLANLIDKLVEANPHVIALDFDTRLPNPNSMQIPEAYQEETSALINSIENAAVKGKKIVLATPIWFDEHGGYRRDSDIYQAYGLCTNGAVREVTRTPMREQAIAKNVTCGYIALPYDPLTIPGPLPLVDGSNLDSFALAIARA